MSPRAEVSIRLGDTEPIRRLIEAAGELAEVALIEAESLEVSENVETPRYVAEALRYAVDDFRKAVAEAIGGSET